MSSAVEAQAQATSVHAPLWWKLLLGVIGAAFAAAVVWWGVQLIRTRAE
jgi:uncharacterized membrane protein YcjF (UPF0283 family)